MLIRQVYSVEDFLLSYSILAGGNVENKRYYFQSASMLHICCYEIYSHPIKESSLTIMVIDSNCLINCSFQLFFTGYLLDIIILNSLLNDGKWSCRSMYCIFLTSSI